MSLMSVEVFNHLNSSNSVIKLIAIFFNYFQVISAIPGDIQKKPRSMQSLMSTFYPAAPYFDKFFSQLGVELVQ